MAVTIEELDNLGINYYDIYFYRYGEDEYEELDLVHGTISDAILCAEYEPDEGDGSDYFAFIDHGDYTLVRVNDCSNTDDYEIRIEDDAHLAEVAKDIAENTDYMWPIY